MTEPTTEAGKALLASLSNGNRNIGYQATMRLNIVAIEQEARSDSVDAFIRDELPGLLAEAVDTLPEFVVGHAQHLTMGHVEIARTLATKVRELHSEAGK